MNGNFTRPSSAATEPPVLFWFKLYAGVMTGLYAICVLAAPVLLFLAGQMEPEDKFKPSSRR